MAGSLTKSARIGQLEREGHPSPASPLAKGLAGLLSVALVVLAVAGNRYFHALVPLHDNGGGILGWLTFTLATLVFVLVVIAVLWIPARFIARRACTAAWLMAIAFLSFVWLLVLVPTIGWAIVDAANMLLDAEAPRRLVAPVLDHRRVGRTRRLCPVIEDTIGKDTMTLAQFPIAPIGTDVEIWRGSGWLGRPYYIPPRWFQRTATASRKAK